MAHETTQQFISLSNQVAQGGEIAPLTAFIDELVPGEFDEIADQLRVLGRETQADALLKIKTRRMVELLSPEEIAVAEGLGIGRERYAQMKAGGR